MRAAIIAGMMAVGLLAGCGTSEGDRELPTDIGTRQDALPDCNGQDYVITYYEDPEHTIWRGEIICGCGFGDQSVLHGYRSAYFERVNHC
ncbi:hypothetical protein [Corallococcus sp. M7]